LATGDDTVCDDIAAPTEAPTLPTSTIATGDNGNGSVGGGSGDGDEDTGRAAGDAGSENSSARNNTSSGAAPNLARGDTSNGSGEAPDGRTAASTGTRNTAGPVVAGVLVAVLGLGLLVWIIVRRRREQHESTTTVSKRRARRGDVVLNPAAAHGFGASAVGTSAVGTSHPDVGEAQYAEIANPAAPSVVACVDYFEAEPNADQSGHAVVAEGGWGLYDVEDNIADGSREGMEAAAVYAVPIEPVQSSPGGVVNITGELSASPIEGSAGYAMLSHSDGAVDGHELYSGYAVVPGTARGAASRNVNPEHQNLPRRTGATTGHELYSDTQVGQSAGGVGGAAGGRKSHPVYQNVPTPGGVADGRELYSSSEALGGDQGLYSGYQVLPDHASGARTMALTDVQGGDDDLNAAGYC
jgi:hypothetical protein